MTTQFHILSFEGPDAYARAGGIASRIIGLGDALAAQGLATHLWFVGDPDAAGHELIGQVHHHRWCQWLSSLHRAGVYDGEHAKQDEYSRTLPPWMFAHVLEPHLRAGGRAVILAEEWHTVHAVLHLDWLLRRAGLRDRVAILWNANNTFGFAQVPWRELAGACTLTTVSRYMRHLMRDFGTSPIVLPNGLGADAFTRPDHAAVAALRDHAKDRTVLTKIARWDPDKGWMATIEIVALLRDRGMKPLLIARGGLEAYGHDVLRAAAARGLRIADRGTACGGAAALVETLRRTDDVDIVNLRTNVDSAARTALFHAAQVVLANSAHEPFGLVGLEAMAAGGLACTGATGEDYAMAGRNAIVLQTGHPHEFAAQFEPLHRNARSADAMRDEGLATAQRYRWDDVVHRNLLPQVDSMFDESAR